MLYGKRVRLRAVERADLPLFVVWFNDPEVREGLSLYRPLSQVDEEMWFESVYNAAPEERPFMIEVRVDSEQWMGIGNCGFHKLDWRVRKAEFGIAIGEKAYWNQGYGSEAVGVLLDHGFNTLNLNRISLLVYEYNRRAIRAYQKAGFTHEGRQRRAHYHAGKYWDILMMSVLKEEYELAGTA